MGYTALDKMREKNLGEYGINGPLSPTEFREVRLWRKDEKGIRKEKPIFEPVSDLETRAIHFIREYCEELGFSYDAERLELNDLDGKSLGIGDIPYNMEKDLDRRCLEVAIHRFLESGVAQDAFDVYFCFLEMFVGAYGKSKKMIEMLSEFESNASSLLMKHRDHYSHSVYVFLLGLAIYDTSSAFRDAYKGIYKERLGEAGGADEEHALAGHFLKYWGISSLFHDIGYPFELSFEQVKSYFGDTIDYVPFVTFNMNQFQTSKAADLKKKAAELKKEISASYSKVILEKREEEPANNTKKLEKKLVSLITDLYGKDAERFAGTKELPCEMAGGSKKAACYIAENVVIKGAAIGQVYLNAILFLDGYMELAKAELKKDLQKLQALLPGVLADEEIGDLNTFLAAALYQALGDDYKDAKYYRSYLEHKENKGNASYQDYLYKVLCDKGEHPERFSGYVDHAYFSAILLLDNLLDVLPEGELNPSYIDAIVAIILHNSLYKRSITDIGDNGPEGYNTGKHVRMEKHPLAFLLMLCDEIQCWDRTSYGRNSRGEVHAMDCEVTFGDNMICANYLFDQDFFDENGELKECYRGKKGTYRKLNPVTDAATGKETCGFLQDIEDIVSINGDDSFDDQIGAGTRLTLKVSREARHDTRYRRSYLSTSNFIHLYRFSILVHKMNHLPEGTGVTEDDWSQMEAEFGNMSLEYKINHISRAKKYAKMLNQIGCFYSDKALDFEVVTSLAEVTADAEDASRIMEQMGAMEHERWVWEHYIMGWANGRKLVKGKDEDERINASSLTDRQLRERTRLHTNMPIFTGIYDKEPVIEHYYEDLTEEEKNKDKRAMNNLLRVLRAEDGIKVYRLGR